MQQEDHYNQHHSTAYAAGGLNYKLSDIGSKPASSTFQRDMRLQSRMDSEKSATNLQDVSPTARRKIEPVPKMISRSGREITPQQSLGAADNIMLKSERKDNFVNFPTHSKKITQHEYEIATSDGKKTVTKRKRTRSTVMLESSADMEESRKKVKARQKLTNQRKGVKASHMRPSTIGDMFGGGSLDPYAFD
ncbi:synaptonemal complex protein 1-like [Cryptomeria japonica]|uniref:synaptonemal complex protein 1-like n=1 Tax=Cryptomeria japonica TaxID=3369 RepID=UPI0027DAA694|nr:synaptonemal complex protein 1-like [Cryptomeria japonica]